MICDQRDASGLLAIPLIVAAALSQLSAALVSFNRSNGQSPLRASVFTAPVTGDVAEGAGFWYAQAGVKRRLLAPALGDTTLYGEYQEWNDFGVRRDAGSVTGTIPTPPYNEASNRRGHPRRMRWKRRNREGLENHSG